MQCLERVKYDLFGTERSCARVQCVRALLKSVCCKERNLNVLFAASAAGLFPVLTFCVRHERHSSANHRERVTCEDKVVAHTFGKFSHHKSSKRTRSPRGSSTIKCALYNLLFVFC